MIHSALSQGVYSTKGGKQLKQTWEQGLITNTKKRAFHQIHEVPVPLFEKDNEFSTSTLHCMLGIGNFGSHISHGEL